MSLFFDDFEAGSGLWTIINNGGLVYTVFTPHLVHEELDTLYQGSLGSVLSMLIQMNVVPVLTINATAEIAAPLNASYVSNSYS